MARAEVQGAGCGGQELRVGGWGFGVLGFWGWGLEVGDLGI